MIEFKLAHTPTRTALGQVKQLAGESNVTEYENLYLNLEKASVDREPSIRIANWYSLTEETQLLIYLVLPPVRHNGPAVNNLLLQIDSIRIN